MDKKFTFKRDERLSSKILIDKLFLEGKSFFIFPFRFIYYQENLCSEHPIQILFSVPKKRFKHACKRNLVRRRLKELYRLKKPDLYNSLNNSGKSYIIALVYSSNKIYPLKFLNERFVLVIEEWQKRIL